MLGAGFIKFHQIFSEVIGDAGGGALQLAFYSVKLCAMINFSLPGFSLQHNVLYLSSVVVLYCMYSLYTIIKVILLDERRCHV